jgi:hypothetical protein
MNLVSIEDLQSVSAFCSLLAKGAGLGRELALIIIEALLDRQVVP